MLVHRIGDPVNSRVVTNGIVGWVYENNLKVLVDSILVDPVRVQYTKSTTFASYALLSNIAKVSGWFQLGNTLIDWLTINNTLQ